MRKTAESRPEPWPEGACGEADGDTYCVNDAGHDDEHHFRSRGFIELKLDGISDEIPEEPVTEDKPFVEGRRKHALTNRPFRRDMVYLEDDRGRLPVKLWRVVSIAGEDIKVQGPYQRIEGGFAPLHDDEYDSLGVPTSMVRKTVTKGDIVGVGGQFKMAANPYSPGGNPYNDPAPGTPDDMMDGPMNAEPETVVPMTTRPRQLPGGNDEPKVDPSITPEQEVVLASMGMLPLACRSTGRKFAARVTLGMQCVCGKRDYDLQSEAMEFDPQFDNRINLMPEADKLPDNDQFAVPFTDDTETEVEPEVDGEVKEGQRKTAWFGKEDATLVSALANAEASHRYWQAQAIWLRETGDSQAFQAQVNADRDTIRIKELIDQITEGRLRQTFGQIVEDIRVSNNVNVGPKQARRMAIKALRLQGGLPKTAYEQMVPCEEIFETGCEGTVTFEGDKWEWFAECDTCDETKSGGRL